MVTTSEKYLIVFTLPLVGALIFTCFVLCGHCVIARYLKREQRDDEYYSGPPTAYHPDVEFAKLPKKMQPPSPNKTQPPSPVQPRQQNDLHQNNLQQNGLQQNYQQAPLQRASTELRLNNEQLEQAQMNGSGKTRLQNSEMKRSSSHTTVKSHRSKKSHHKPKSLVDGDIANDFQQPGQQTLNSEQLDGFQLIGPQGSLLRTSTDYLRFNSEQLLRQPQTVSSYDTGLETLEVVKSVKKPAAKPHRKKTHHSSKSLVDGSFVSDF